MASLKDIYEERLENFQQGYEWQDMNAALMTLSGAGELVELVYGESSAERAMSAIRAIIDPSYADGPSSDEGGSPVRTTWREMWKCLDLGNGFQSSPLLEAIHDLNAFGNFGILPVWSVADSLEEPNADRTALQARLLDWQDVPAKVEAVCVDIDRLEALAPQRADAGSSLSALLATRNQARARLKYDASAPITIHELAALSNVSVKRIQNAVYAKTEEAPVIAKNGLISHETCKTWLTTRDYHPSIWQQIATLTPFQPNWGKDVLYEAPEENHVFDDYVIVPVAGDGSAFHPGLARKSGGREGGFTIGAKGAEQVVHGFDKALEALTTMVTPRWRRPNPESGNWGIVSGQTWKRLRSSEFEALTR